MSTHLLTRKDRAVLDAQLKRLDPPQGSPPCAGCTLCCWKEQLLLHPEMGDDPTTYECDEVRHPFTGEPAFALKHKDGHCIYLDPRKGCTIHDRAPAVCREFDCRGVALAINRRDAHQLAAKGIVGMDVYNRGKALLKR